MAKLSNRSRSMIARQVKDRGIVVWYDPEKAYSGLIQDLDFPETTVLQYADSFFRLRHELEPHLEFVTPRQNPRTDAALPQILSSISPWNEARHPLP